MIYGYIRVSTDKNFLIKDILKQKSQKHLKFTELHSIVLWKLYRINKQKEWE